MNKIVPVVIGVIIKDNKFLLTYRNGKHEPDWANNHWQFPGGGLEFGESPEKTLLREMKEEVGLDVSIKYLIPKIFTKRIHNWQGLFICYVCGHMDTQTIILNSEATKYGWFSLSEVKKLKTLPGTVDLAAKAST